MRRGNGPESQLNLADSISRAAVSKYTEATVTAIEGPSCSHTVSGFIYRKPWVFLTIAFDNLGAFRGLNAWVNVSTPAYLCSNRHGTLQKSSGSRTFYHQDGRGGQALYVSVNKAHVFSSMAQLDVTNHQIP